MTPDPEGPRPGAPRRAPPEAPPDARREGGGAPPAGRPAPPLRTAVETARRALVVQPPPDALGVSQAMLLPLLYACGRDPFDLAVLRSDGLPTSARAAWRLAVPGDHVGIEVLGVPEPLERPSAPAAAPRGAPWGLRTNGASWLLLEPDGRRHPFSLFDASFPAVLHALCGLGPEGAATRLARAAALLRGARLREAVARFAREEGSDALRAASGSPAALLERLAASGLLERPDPAAAGPDEVRAAVDGQLRATELGLLREAPPLAHVDVEDVLRLAEPARNLRGGLETTFDDVPVPIRSRSAYYYVLAALALRFGREDAVPARDLVRPPETLPEGVRARPLGRPGWHLRLDGEPRDLEEGVATLLESMNLAARFRAVQRGRPWPDPDL